MQWEESHRCDPRGRALADRHYSRQSIGAKNFVQPGRTFVLVHSADYLEGADAVWVTTWPFAEYVRHAWGGEGCDVCSTSYAGIDDGREHHVQPGTQIAERHGIRFHETPGTWNNALFRNESGMLSSALIRQAVAATREHWGDPPPGGIVTMVWKNKVLEKKDIGRAYLEAGFRHVGQTKAHDKDVFILLPEDMPAARSMRHLQGEASI
jgi:hypothetical protein